MGYIEHMALKPLWGLGICPTYLQKLLAQIHIQKYSDINPLLNLVRIWCNLDWTIQIINTDHNLERIDGIWTGNPDELSIASMCFEPIYQLSFLPFARFSKVTFSPIYYILYFNYNNGQYLV